MKNIIKYLFILPLAVMIFSTGCGDENYALGDLKAPANLNVSYDILGANETNPNGDGSGKVTFTVSADNAITYNFDFGDGQNIEPVPSGKVTHLFSKTGLNTYNVTVSAVGTGGMISLQVVQLDVYSSFSDDEAVAFLTNGSSKTWYWAADVPGHAGMGTQGEDYGNLDYTFASWWSIGPFDSDKACMYDAELVFSKTDVGMTFELMEGSLAWIPGTYAGDIGVDGDICIGDDIAPTMYGVKNVTFFPSTSKAAIDGKYRGTSMLISDGGFLDWYVGTSEYDIIEVTENILKVRIKEDETQAWYHIFTDVKPVQ